MEPLNGDLEDDCPFKVGSGVYCGALGQLNRGCSYESYCR